MGGRAEGREEAGTAAAEVGRAGAERPGPGPRGAQDAEQGLVSAAAPPPPRKGRAPSRLTPSSPEPPVTCPPSTCPAVAWRPRPARPRALDLLVTPPPPSPPHVPSASALPLRGSAFPTISGPRLLSTIVGPSRAATFSLSPPPSSPPSLYCSSAPTLAPLLRTS